MPRRQDRQAGIGAIRNTQFFDYRPLVWLVHVRGGFLPALSVEVRLLGKKQPLQMDVQWIPPDGPEHAERLRGSLAEFVARSLRPDFYKTIDECQEAMREADSVIASSRELLASLDKKSRQDTGLQERIADLEAEIAKLKGKLEEQD